MFIGLVKIFNDILKVNDPEKTGTDDRYSFSRIALLICLVAYLCTAVVYVFMSLNAKYTASPEMISAVLNSLEYPIVIFTGYSFGGKSLKVLETIMNFKNKYEIKSKEE